jgi:hypothetical protein
MAVKLEADTEIFDTREATDKTLLGQASRVAWHGANMIKSILDPKATERLRREKNASYGDADRVLISQPPLPALRQKLRRASDLPYTQPGFMLVRDNPAKSVTVKQIGTAHHYAGRGLR